MNGDQRLELLAPAGSMESLRSAVLAGADAVYVGTKDFNARRSAANFTLAEIAEAVEFAHTFGTKVYVTVNILTHDEELEQVGRLVVALAERDVDALIVQDLGVARLARELVPEIELHASTQMTVHNAEGVRLAERMGFSRVILARELSLQQVRAIHNACPGVGLEVFVHGALCYGYSGQCLLSSLIGGRSGNRGGCAQPCRLPYTLYREERPLTKVGLYLLSPKDLRLIDHLTELQDAGICAVKIEGRLKRPEYVYTVVKLYREALDAGKGFELTQKVEAELLQAFNRGFTHGFLMGERGPALMSSERPDNRGLPIGRVVESASGQVSIKLARELRKGDVLSWRYQNQTITWPVPCHYRAGMLLELSHDRLPAVGDEVTRVVSAAQSEQARLAQREWPARFKLAVQAEVSEGAPLYLRGEDDTGLTAEVVGKQYAETARKRPVTEELICKQLARLGSTPYGLTECSVNITGRPTLSVSEINSCRRKLVQKLTERRLAAFRKYVKPETRLAKIDGLLQKTGPRAATNPLLAVSVASLEEAKAAMQAGADLIYWGVERAGSWQFAQLESALRKWGSKLVLRLPRISSDEQMAASSATIKALVSLGLSSVLIDNLGQLSALQHADLLVGSSTGIPVFNSLSVQELSEYGVSWVTLSLELNAAQIDRLLQSTAAELEAVVHGRILLMINENCVVGASGMPCGELDCCQGAYSLEDRLGLRFPVFTDKYHRSYIYNSQDLALLDQVPFFIARGINRLRVEAAGRGPGYVKLTTSAYRNAIDAALNGCPIDVNYFYQEFLRFSPQGLTKGHFRRGV